MSSPRLTPSRKKWSTVLALAVAGVSLPALADKVWNTTTGTWDTVANWSPNGAPTSNDQVFITTPGANVTYVNNNSSQTFPALYLGATGASGASVSQSQYTLNVDQEYIGDQNKGAYIQSGGTHNVTGNIGMTVGGGGTGSYTLSGSGALNVRNLLTVGDLGTGTFTMNGGQVTLSSDAGFTPAVVVGSSINAVGVFNLNTGTFNTGDLQLAPYGGNGTFNQSGGAANVAGDLALSDPTFGGTSLYNHTGGTLAPRTITISAGGTLKHAGGTLRTTAISIATNNARIDLTNQKMVVDYTGATPLATIKGKILSGYAGAAWTGSGITSSTAASDQKTGIAYAEATSLFNFGTSTTNVWFGQTVDSTSVLLRNTLYGDATMDGVVDFNDLVKLAQNYNAPTGKNWLDGDFNYDGAIDFNDLVKLAQNYNTSLPAEAVPGAPADFSSAWAAAMASVPEPSGGILGLAAVTLWVQKRRRNRSPV